MGMVSQFCLSYYLKNNETKEEEITPPVSNTETPATDSNDNNTKVEVIYKEKIVKIKDKGYHVSKDEVSKLIEKPARVTQGINPKHLRYIIEQTLIYIGVPKEEIPRWADLLLITAQVESDMGYLLKQVRGPAQGVFQLEPATEKWLWQWLKKNKPELGDKIRKLRCEAHLGAHEAQYNLAYATAMAYLEYYHRKTTPVGKSVMEMLQIHKKFYNTDLGKASVSNSLKKLTGSKVINTF